MAERSSLDDDNGQINPADIKCPNDFETCCSLKDLKPETNESPTTTPVSTTGKNPNLTLVLNPIKDTAKQEVLDDTVAVVDKPPRDISDNQRPEPLLKNILQLPSSSTPFPNSNFESTVTFSSHDNVPYNSYASQPSSPYKDITIAASSFYPQNNPTKLVQNHDLFPSTAYAPTVSYDSKYTIPYKQSSAISTSFYTQNSPKKVVKSQSFYSPTIFHDSYGTQNPASYETFPLDSSSYYSQYSPPKVVHSQGLYSRTISGTHYSTSYEKYPSVSSFFTQNTPIKVVPTHDYVSTISGTQYSAPYEKFLSVNAPFYTQNSPTKVVSSQVYDSPAVPYDSYVSQYSEKPKFIADPLSQLGSSLVGGIDNLLKGLGSGGIRVSLNLR